MSDSRRISGVQVDLDYEATQRFFERRGRREYANRLSATMYQDREPLLVEARDQVEKAVVEAVLDLSGVQRVLDIGCGLGRWGWFLRERCSDVQYLGIDFSKSLIDKAQEEASRRGFSGLDFQVMSATELNPGTLLLPPPFDLLLIGGLLMYLNDLDCLKVLRDAACLAASGGVIYLREPVGVNERFTLNKFYSEELGDEYSAIYRTVDELYALMRDAFADKGLKIERESFLFPDGLEKRTETRQYFFIIRREVAR